MHDWRHLLAGLALMWCCGADSGVTVAGGSFGVTQAAGSNFILELDMLAFELSATEGGTINLCASPCPVSFYAGATSYPNKTIQDITFIWDFGDSTAGTIPRRGLDTDLNTTGRGPVAGHVYVCPEGGGNCTFNGTLTAHVIDGITAVSDQTTFTVIVEDPATTWGGSATVCYGASSTGCPAGATYGGASPVFNHHNTSATRTLFQRGGTYNMTSNQTFGATKSLWGAYGSGADPLINATAATGSAISANSTCAGHRITGLDFRGPGVDAGVNTLDFAGGGHCLLVHDVDLSPTAGHEFANVWTASDGNPTTWDNQQLYAYKFRATHSGINCSTNCAGPAVFWSAIDSFFIASEIDDIRGDAEHDFRCSTCQRLVLDANYLSGNFHTAGKEVIAIRGDSQGRQPTEFVGIYRNEIQTDGLSLKFGETNSGTCNTETGTTVRLAWVDGNSFEFGTDTAQAYMQFQYCGSSGAPGFTGQLTFRDNYVNDSNNTHSASDQVRLLQQTTEVGAVGSVTDIRAIGNTLIWNGATTLTSASTTIALGSSTGAVCANNVIALKSTGTITICGNGVGVGQTNHDESDASVDDLWSGTTGFPAATSLDFDDLKITSADPLHSTGTALVEPPDVRDHFGNACPQGSTEIGPHCIAD